MKTFEEWLQEEHPELLIEMPSLLKKIGTAAALVGGGLIGGHMATKSTQPPPVKKNVCY